MVNWKNSFCCKENLVENPNETKPLLDSTPEDYTVANEDISSKWGTLSRQATLFVIMLLVNVLGPLSTEAQVPALEDIAKELHTTSQLVQLTITIYMLSFGASQLVFGTLSDMYGRRNTLLVGLVIYTLTNLGCALSPNIIALNIFRAVQAMGSGAGMVIVYAIARDVFEQDQRTRVLGILGGLRPIVIAGSPVFGGTVSAFLGWRFIFYIIGALSFLLLILVFFLLPETRDPNTIQIRRPRDYLNTVRLLVQSRVFVGLVLISGAVYAGVFIMFNEFSFVMEDDFGFNEFDVGLLCGLIVGGLLVGSIISIILVRYFNPIRVVEMGIFQMVICGGALIAPLFLFKRSTVYWTVIPLFCYVMGDGLMLPHLISSALEPFQHQAGTASALAGFWRFFSAAVIASIASASSTQHFWVLHIGTSLMTIVSVMIYIITLFNADTAAFTSSHTKKSTPETDDELESHISIPSSLQNNNVEMDPLTVQGEYGQIHENDDDKQP